MVFKPGVQNVGVGPSHPTWRGGVRHVRDYIELMRRGHHFANKNGYVAAHRLVYEESRSCCLLPWADIHHRDGVRSNNVWYNLEALSRGQHITKHNWGNTYARKL